MTRRVSLVVVLISCLLGAVFVVAFAQQPRGVTNPSLNEDKIRADISFFPTIA